MKIGIVGTTGYGGAELLRLLHHHPHVDEVILYSSSRQGSPIHEAYPHLTNKYEQSLQELDTDTVAAQVDAVFFGDTPRSFG